MEEVKDDEDNNTQKYQKHVANSFGLKYNCIHKEYSEPVKIFNSSNQKLVVKKFVEINYLIDNFNWNRYHLGKHLFQSINFDY